MEIAFRKAVIKSNILTALQKRWDEGNKVCHIYKIKQTVGEMKTTGKTSREQTKHIKAEVRTYKVK